MTVAKRTQINGSADAGRVFACLLQLGCVAADIGTGYERQFLEDVANQVGFNVGDKRTSLLHEEVAQVVRHLLTAVKHLRRARLQHVTFSIHHDHQHFLSKWLIWSFKVLIKTNFWKNEETRNDDCEISSQTGNTAYRPWWVWYRCARRYRPRFQIWNCTIKDSGWIGGSS